MSGEWSMASAWVRVVQQYPPSRLVGRPALLDRMRHIISNERPSSLLDVGCGDGFALIAAHNRVDYAVGIDSAADIYRAECYPKYLNVDNGTATNLPYPDATFDVVVCAMVLHLLDADELAEAVAELARVLRPGGTLLWSVVDPDAPTWSNNHRPVPALPLQDGEERPDVWDFNFDVDLPSVRASYYRRPLTTYARLLTQMGLTIEWTHLPVATMPGVGDRYARNEYLLSTACKAS